jgi:hypothetical protein
MERFFRQAVKMCGYFATAQVFFLAGCQAPLPKNIYKQVCLDEGYVVKSDGYARCIQKQHYIHEDKNEKHHISTDIKKKNIGFMEKHRQKCIDFGYRPGTSLFIRCIYIEEERRISELK